jgi:hypothetical protein
MNASKVLLPECPANGVTGSGCVYDLGNVIEPTKEKRVSH